MNFTIQNSFIGIGIRNRFGVQGINTLYRTH